MRFLRYFALWKQCICGIHQNQHYFLHRNKSIKEVKFYQIRNFLFNARRAHKLFYIIENMSINLNTHTIHLSIHHQSGNFNAKPKS